MEVQLSQMNALGARYVVIGGQAMLQEGMPRFTLDWDLFIPYDDSNNFDRINQALAGELDLDLLPFDPKTGEGFIQTFQTGAGIIQFHQMVPGLPKFDSVETRSIIRDYKGVPIRYLCLDDLLASKLAVARDKDSDDILFLTMKKQTAQKQL
jgi:hypothetical protein